MTATPTPKLAFLTAPTIAPTPTPSPIATSDPTKAVVSPFIETRQSNPSRTVVTGSDGKWVATFTDGARTVALAGPSRTFSESTAANAVVSSAWVRVLPTPFAGHIDQAWLTAALADTSPDILHIAMQYVGGAPPMYGGGALQIAGDANYGPLLADGTRQEGSDFNDYLGIPWTYGLTVDQPESLERYSLDCSGYMRMVWGYRGGMAMSISPTGAAIPRRSFEIYESGPGLVVIPNGGGQAFDVSRLQAGDLVFFDIATDDGARIDHVGMYLGKDTGGNHRFISSRKSANGPTLGDANGRSTLNGTGLFAVGFRAARRF